MTISDPPPSSSRSAELARARKRLEARRGRTAWSVFFAFSTFLLLAISIHLAGDSWLLAIPFTVVILCWLDTLLAAYYTAPRPSIRDRSSLVKRTFGLARAIWGALLFGMAAAYAVLADRYVGNDGVTSQVFTKAAEQISTAPMAVVASILVVSTTMLVAADLAAATDEQRNESAEQVATLLGLHPSHWQHRWVATLTRKLIKPRPACIFAALGPIAIVWAVTIFIHANHAVTA